MKSCFHTHSRFCDGNGDLEDYVIYAIESGFDILGFSGHSPLPFPTTWNMAAADVQEYLSQAKGLKTRYASQIQLFVGLETDWFPGCTDWRTEPSIDFTIGAVHFLPHPETGAPMALDGSLEDFKNTLELGFNGRIESLCRNYYATLRRMLMSRPPNILAHLDVIRKNNSTNRFFNGKEAWYIDEITKTLELLLLLDVILEVNTGGMARGYTKSPYPSWEIMTLVKDMNIPIMLNSDAHHPHALDYAYVEVTDRLLALGYKTQRVLDRGRWQDVSLK